MTLPYDIINGSYTWSLWLFGAAMLTLIGRSARKYITMVPSPRQPLVKRQDSMEVEEALDRSYYNIVSLKDFNVDAEEPIKARPFKPKFHMTMAIENTTLSDLVAMDKTYHERIKLRRKLLKSEHHEVIGTNKKADPAVFELYEWLTQTYLPCRFPTMFIFTPTGLLNKTTNEKLPLHPSSAAHALETMGSHIDTDLLLLLPSSVPEDDAKYRLEAFVTCFPSGFSTRRKLGLLLAAIHAPVPRYATKLERSMDKFFASLPVGRIVRRWNWTVSTTGQLFCVAGNHAAPEDVGQQDTHVDLSTTFLRCERQTLHRLPESGACVFAFKTYQYPIAEVRDDGSAEAMCEAIDGMGTGSVPEMMVYKRQTVWGDKVKRFLRGEIEIDA